MKQPNAEWTRRGFVLAGAAALTSSRLLRATPACTLVPEQEEGPFYIDTETMRRNLTEGRPGIPLQLRVMLLAKRCVPLENAAVHIWHCDAVGVYSGFAENAGGPGGGRGRGPGGTRGGGPGRSRVTDEARFLRGVQVTNPQGIAEFETLYPGWYAGRTIHIHLKVHLGGAAGEHYAGGHVSHTGQFFFPEEVTAEIAQMDPYVTHGNVHRTLHSEDHVFLSQGGAQTLMSLERLNKGSNAGGFLATVALGATPTAF